ncbi:hypothetical protein NBO_460g0001 [Nosema bombycis CQ1]|uniref:Uncharacterized protein n=1 Tax=Nosema bombycis (strain CQ1 / CVCC 102059) TaxID=578461 RepID=R0MHT8_NOSB1|nr:hypothetical protein NBO_460g0001 [Nosema bombycis CQ1]|eukprot:EOB12343.1 hypothetical protein NBO_460g0001 [Nosema bombycis CQ1]
MPSETYFTTETKDIDKLLNTKEHTKIYLNIRKEEEKDILYCTKNKGQDLYIVSTNNYKNIT